LKLERVVTKCMKTMGQRRESPGLGNWKEGTPHIYYGKTFFKVEHKACETK